MRQRPAHVAGSALGPPAAGLAVDLTGSYTPAIVASALLGLAAYAALLPLDARAGERPDTNHD